MRISLRRELLFILIGLTTIPLILLGGMLIYGNYRTQKKDAVDIQGQIARQIAIQAADDIEESENNARLIADTYDLLSLNRQDQQKILESFILYDHNIEAATLVDQTGMEVAHAVRTKQPAEFQLQDLSTKPEFQVPFSSGQSYYGPVESSNTSRKPVISFSTAIHDPRTKKINGVFLITANLDQIAALVTNQSRELNQNIFITAEDGSILAHADPSFVQGQGNYLPAIDSGIANGINGDLVVFSAVSFQVGSQQFNVIAEKSARAVFYSISPILIMTLSTLFLVLVASLLLSWRAGNQITEPIMKLADLAQSIESGDLTKRADINSYDEIGRLASALNSMAENLQGTINSLAHSNSVLEMIKVDLQKQNLTLTALQEATLSLMSQMDLEKVLQAIIMQAARLLHSTNGFLYLVDLEQDNLIMRVGVGINAAFTGARLEHGEGLAGKIWDAGISMLIGDYQNWEGRSAMFNNLPIHSIAGVPLKNGNQVIGVLGIDQLDEHVSFSQNDVDLLTNFGQLASIALDNARLFKNGQDELEERKRMETILQRTEEQYRTLVEKVPAITYIDSAENKWETLYISPQVEKILGVPQSRWRNENFTLWESIIHPEDRLTAVKTFDEFFDRGGEIDIEYRVVKPDNTIVWIHDQAIMLRDASGNRLSIQGVMFDITERKLAEEQTKKQVERLKALRTIDISIASSTNLDLTLQVLLKQAQLQLNVDAANVAMFNSELNMLEYSGGAGFRPTRFASKSLLRINETPAGQVITSHKSIHIQDLRVEMEKYTQFSSLFGEAFISYYGVPLITKGKIKGVMEIYHNAPLDLDDENLDFLESLAGQAGIAIENSLLFDNLQRTNMDLVRAYETTLEGWSAALDLRDKETEGHTQRVTHLTLKLAQAMHVRERDMTNIKRGALLHDIGKMGVPDRILQKRSSLSKEEKGIMQQHPVYAYNLLNQIQYLRSALDIPYCHHEKWDGTGYPQKLKGEEIPFPARLFAVVDVYDALTSDRPYRKGWSKEQAVEFIKKESGHHFDPGVVEAFIKLLQEISLD